ncbi:MAG: T9SS type A sorting domain-containing protein, partial [Flavobacteriaceae bacterium]|nr:T9SS type A sorting domain-containing protein [Flavobacteriaceae bacterium]
ICCNSGEGSYSLLTDNNLVIKASDGTFGSGETTQMITKYATEFQPEAVILTPNPAAGIFRITGYKSGLEYTIYNMLGQALKEGVLEENLIDLSGLSANIYLIRITEAATGVKVVRKIIIE